MKVVKFLPGIRGGRGRMQIRQDFKWEMLKQDLFTAAQSDIRFTLHDGPDENTAILIDLDHTLMVEGLDLMECALEVFGEYKMYHLFTGGGHHLYIPLKTPLAGTLYRNYRESYYACLEELEDIFPWNKDSKGEFDYKVFVSPKYGRLPGTLNSKYNVAVKYLGETDYPVAESIDDLLDYEDLPQVYRTITGGIPGGSAVYNNCGFVRWADENQKDIEYDAWFTAVTILAVAGDKETAHKISCKHKDYDPEEIDSLFIPGKANDYHYQCQNIANKFGSQTTACVGCPHNVVGSCPSYVTGPLPTPSAHIGFHPMTAKGVLNDRMIHAQEVLHHWINSADGNLLYYRTEIYSYNGVRWETLGSAYDREFPKAIMSALKAIPTGKTLVPKALQELKAVVKDQTEMPTVPKGMDFNGRKYINCKNGVLDLESQELYEHSREFYLSTERDIVYDKNAECLRWYALLDDIMDADDELLLQVFFGLAISNVTTYEYESYLWLKGMPDTGKTLISKVLVALVGKANVYPLKGVPETKEGSITLNLHGKQVVWFDDPKFDEAGKTVRAWEGLITTLTSSDEVMCRLPYIPSTVLKLISTVIVTANSFPPLSSVSEGGVRRCRIIELYKTPKKKDPKLINKLQGELSGILNWALDGLDYFNKHGMPPRGKRETAVMDIWVEDSYDIVHQFVEQNLKKGDKEDIVKGEKLYNVFLVRTQANETIWSAAKFGRRLKRELPKLLQKHISNIKLRRSDGYYYVGVKIKGE